MLERMRRLAQPTGTVAAVMPQTWLYLKAYEALRRTLIGTSTFSVVVDLGPAAFQDMNWWAARTALVVVQNTKPTIRNAYLAIDADTGRFSKGQRSFLDNNYSCKTQMREFLQLLRALENVFQL